jgi:hypothetical protein
MEAGYRANGTQGGAEEAWEMKRASPAMTRTPGPPERIQRVQTDGWTDAQMALHVGNRA